MQERATAVVSLHSAPVCADKELPPFSRLKPAYDRKRAGGTQRTLKTRFTAASLYFTEKAVKPRCSVSPLQ